MRLLFFRIGQNFLDFRHLLCFLEVGDFPKLRKRRLFTPGSRKWRYGRINIKVPLQNIGDQIASLTD